MESFDEQLLRKVAVPSLSADRAHQEELRRALMQEARQRIDPSADPSAPTSGAGSGGQTAHPWLPLPRWAMAASVLIVAVGAIWVGRAVFLSDRSKTAVTPRSTTTMPAGPGFSAAIGIGRDSFNEREARELADAVSLAIEKGNFELEQILASQAGGSVYLYNIQLSKEKEITAASDRALTSDPLAGPDHAQQFEDAIAQDRGRYFGEGASGLGSKLYRYRVSLPDGTTETFATEQEPDLAARRQHRKELEQAMVQSRGVVAQKIAALDGTTLAVMKVTLADGTIKTYARPQKMKTN